MTSAVHVKMVIFDVMLIGTIKYFFAVLIICYEWRVSSSGTVRELFVDLLRGSLRVFRCAERRRPAIPCGQCLCCYSRCNAEGKEFMSCYIAIVSTTCRCGDLRFSQGFSHRARPFFITFASRSHRFRRDTASTSESRQVMLILYDLWQSMSTMSLVSVNASPYLVCSLSSTSTPRDVCIGAIKTVQATTEQES